MTLLTERDKLASLWWTGKYFFHSWWRYLFFKFNWWTIVHSRTHPRTQHAELTNRMQIVV